MNSLKFKYAFTADGWEDYQYWMENNLSVFRKINSLIKDCQRSPFFGIGKPEPLSGEFSGYWSRRITNEHRLIYRYEGGSLLIFACRFHYRRH